ncbi:thiolase domain-containing protein [Rhodococcus sp. NM-2]|uniref:Acetyl-CoA acetyltransferase n=1 Tax=Rhodococcus oxybenzonivorans TaxID=1990687 RepID=A0A2S2C6R3_9NOCA|nr:thiolase domain-containing protein [Rhodococcus oxybenzonivorans]AWK76503.1 acetyl-CoA acetyltransferase [Rhodococcus oxybenzonivorans]
MSIKGKAFIAGAYEHPGRELPDKSIPQIHAEVALGALADAGLGLADVDGYFCGADAPGLGGLAMADYLGLNLRHMDSSDMGGSVYMSHVGHAAAAIASGKCRVALITLGGRPRTTSLRAPGQLMGEPPEKYFEPIFGANVSALYALAAQRHMYEYGTTSEQLAEIKVAASVHAQYNENAMLRKVVTVEEVVNSPIVSSPLHRLDCCVVTDGGGALVLVADDIAATLDRHCVKILGHGEAVEHTRGGWQDITTTGGVRSGADAFGEAGVSRADIDYVGLYDSFTITVLLALEDLGFCPKGEGGKFVQDGALQSPNGRLPFNTDGGSLCNNHPANRGGMTKIIEAVRQLRNEAHPAVQVPDCELALAHGTGGWLSTRMGNATVILGREGA